MAEIMAIDKRSHKDLKIKANPNFVQSAAKHFAPLVVQEFVAASQEFPVVFIKDSETGQFKAIALLGLKPQQNLFYSETGWQAGYTPESLTFYPFVLHHNVKDDQAVVCFDPDSALVNNTEGEALFDDSGNASPWFSAQSEKLVKYVEKGFVTQRFIKLLADKELLTAQSLNLKLDEEYSLNGFYIIDENKLNTLSEKDFQELRKIGALAPIYASLISMQRIQYLIKRKLSK